MDFYRSFGELEKHETPFEDYLIDMKKGSSSIAVMAPHGGGIEFGTASIAQSIADPDHTFWTFRGIKKNNNRVLHITSTNFNAPGALMVASAAQTVVTVHGCRENSPSIYVGGRHEKLISLLRDTLFRAGFDTRRAARLALRGENPLNLCNRCAGGRGVQLEITSGLRETMFTRYRGDVMRRETETFFRLADAVKIALGPFR